MELWKAFIVIRVGIEELEPAAIEELEELEPSGIEELEKGAAAEAEAA
jgi:hypothetical protein